VPAKLLIRGGVVHDGTGAPPVRADVAVTGGRISAIRARPGDLNAARTIEADGLVVAPGFIDMHSHADFTLPAYPGAVNSISQGVTTEVLGNCGYSPAPLAEDRDLRAGQRAAGLGLGPDLEWNWRSFDEFVHRLADSRPAVNTALLVGHGTLRLGVVGGDDRPATADELAVMHAHVAEALDAGAFGMSTGLVYPPGSFASTDEILAVAASLAPAGALYASHIRSEGDGLAEALEEAVTIGARLGTNVEVSHLKAAGRRNHGRIAEAHGILDRARIRGVNVTQDVYPYTAGSTLLTQLLPPWVQDGGIDALVERLGSREIRDRVTHEVENGLPGWMSYAVVSGGWDQILIAAVGSPSLRDLEGRTIADAARQRQVAPLDLVLDTLITDHAATTMIVSLMAEADVEAALSHSATAIGSDQFQVTSRDARVHPRAYGTFARVLGRVVRERALLTLPEAIRRMTGLPASILRLADRGRVAEGLVADLVVFDADRIVDTSTYAAPTSLAVGVEAVLIGGHVAVESGAVVDARLGRVLTSRARGRRPRSLIRRSVG
jgi:N-acyl-D-amino-acid deacylase